jgi:hypothetical protein
MQFSRIVWLAGGAALLAAWLTAAATKPPPSQPGARASAPPAATPDPIVVELQAQVERLKQRQLAVDVPERTVRNPFELGRRITPTEVSAASLEEPPALPVIGSPPSAAVGVPYTLAGIAEHKTADGVVLTAIISGIDGVRLLRVGGDLAGRYLVVTIEPHAVELEDRESGERRRLSLP